jgi:hypothetical protein
VVGVPGNGGGFYRATVVGVPGNGGGFYRATVVGFTGQRWWVRARNSLQGNMFFLPNNYNFDNSKITTNTGSDVVDHF